MSTLLRIVPAWKQLDTWRSNQRILNNHFFGDPSTKLAAYSDALSGAMANLYSGMANVAAQAALNRIQAAIKAKLGASATQPYIAPINPSTGKQYVSTAAPAVTAGSGINILA